MLSGLSYYIYPGRSELVPRTVPRDRRLLVKRLNLIGGGIGFSLYTFTSEIEAGNSATHYYTPASLFNVLSSVQ